MMSDAAALQFERVSWSYRRGRCVLDAVDLAVSAGEIVALGGANGSGKTTLARLAAGALVPRGGTARRAHPVAYVPQASDDPPLRLRASQWLSSLTHMTGRRGPGAQDAIDSLGLSAEIERPLTDLSTGTVVKVLVAGALTTRPRLLVCDEPFADLDQTSRDAVAALLHTAADGGCGVLVTDHDSSARSIADRHLDVTDGRLQSARDDAPRWRVVLDGPGGTTTHVVDAIGRDALLLDALQSGRSVLSVERQS